MISASRLLELSLSIGGSLDLRANCESFLDNLNSAAELSSAAVWLKHRVLTGEGSSFGEEAEDVAILVHGDPPERFDTVRLPLDHSIFHILAEHPAISVDPEHEHFYGLRTERQIHRGVISVFALGELGFLHMYSTYRHGPLTRAEIQQLGEVVAKFTASLEACLSHHRLTREVALRRRAETQLQHREEHFRALIENALDLILVLRYDATVTFASPSVQRALGIVPEVLEGRNFFEFVHPDEVAGHFQAFLTQVKNPGITPAVEMRLRHAAGGWRTLAVSSNNLLSVPSVAGIILNCHDMTESKKIREALRRTEERYALAVRGASDGLWDWDLVTDEIFYSQRWQEMLGLEQIDATPAGWFDRVHHEDLHGLRTAIDEHLAGRAAHMQHEHRVLHADGEYRWMLARAVAVHDEAGTPYRMAGSQTDVSERRAWIRELEEARQRALEASQAKSAFVAHMSHEIRNPLNGVVGMASMLLDSELSAEQRTCASTIRVSADTLAAIIADILDFSRIESGKLELAEEPFRIARCVESTLDMVAPMAADKDLELVCDLDPELPELAIGDPTRFRQILLNLLSNAVKFTHEGEVVVTVRWEEPASPGPQLHISVRDTGIGITPDQAARLFRPFTQADVSTTRKFGGTGLGLAISARLCELMGGSIKVSQPEAGGAQLDVAVRVRVPRTEVFQRPAPAELRDRRILLVEDNRSQRNCLHQMLERLQMRVADAADIGSALRLMGSGNGFDLALVDQHLPDGDGRELAAELCARRPELPVVLMRPITATTNASEHVCAAISKPIKSGLLVSTLLAAVGAEAAAEREAPAEEEPASAVPAGIRVLVAEDNAISRQVALMILKRLRCHVVCVEDGLAAVNAVRDGSFDLVLMDVQMPGMDGFEATRRILELDGPRPRIAALTAHASDTDRERCLEAGMHAYICKPIRIETVRGILRELDREIDASAPIDRARLEILLASGGPDMLGELIEMYLEDAPRQLLKLDDAIRHKDRQLLRDAAHKLKGASANLGVSGVAEAATAVEEGSETGSWVELEDLTAALRGSVERARPLLQEQSSTGTMSRGDSP